MGRRLGRRHGVTGWDLAIDFGTSFTTAATLVRGRAEVLEIDGSKYVPSLVCLDDDGTVLTGRDAVNEAAMAPDRTERVPKRALVASEQVLLGERTVTTVDLVAAVSDGTPNLHHFARTHQRTLRRR